MDRNIVIVVDSVADIPEEWIQKWNIQVISLVINFGGIERQDMEVTTDDVFNFYYKYKQLPTTNPPKRDTFFNMFNKFVFQGYDVIYFATTDTISRTYDEAVASIETHNFAEHIHIINSRFASVGIAPLVYQTATLLDSGASLNEVLFKAEQLIKNHNKTYFIVEDTAYLLENSNVGKISEIFAGLFGVKPALTFDNGGNIIPVKKFTGSNKKLMPKFAEYTFSDKNVDESMLIIGHSGATPEMLRIAEECAKKYVKFEKVLFCQTGSIITSHLGRGAIIYTFQTK